MFTRSEFDATCKALVAQQIDDGLAKQHLTGWKWCGALPYGYLTRTKQYLGTGFGVEWEEEEDSATTSSSTECVTCQQYIVFSPTFRVPAFYFTAHDSTGTPLSLDALMASSVFHFQVPEGSRANGFAFTLPDTPFPLLSQGDHPTLGSPCWFIHPCESESAVDELVREAGVGEEGRLLRWLELWLMTVGTVVHL